MLLEVAMKAESTRHLKATCISIMLLAFIQTPSRASNCAAYLRALAPFAPILIPAAIHVTGRTVSYLSRTARGALRGQPYLGHGIFYDRNEILEKFDAPERELLSRAKEDPQTVIELVNQKLHGNFEFGISVFSSNQAPLIIIKSLLGFPDRPRPASSLFDSEKPDRGVCRHKARVMVAFFGIWEFAPA